MKKKNKLFISGFVGVILLIIIIFVGGAAFFIFRTVNKYEDLGEADLSRKADIGFKHYQNTRYDYGFSYPESWFVGFIGSNEQEAGVVWVGPNEEDVEETMGGSPVGVKFEVITFDLPDMKKEAPDLPQIGTVREWVDWQRSNWTDYQVENIIGKYRDENVTVNGVEAIRTYFSPPENNPAGRESQEVQVMDRSKERVYLLKYYGREPAYSENISNFERIVDTFTF